MERINEIIIKLPSDITSVYPKKLAKQKIEFHLSLEDLAYPQNMLLSYTRVNDDLIGEYHKLKGDSERIVFLCEIVNYLNQVISDIENIDDNDFYNSIGDKEIAKNKIEELQYWIASELSNLGYNIDANQFTSAELNDLTDKVDKIVEALDKLQGGQTVLYDRIEELKDDFKDILSASGLGKKSVTQRITGVVVGYIAEKGADEVYQAIKPFLNDTVENFTKLIG